jgi:DNA-directed RNA polymerase subunit RPC12/RpoP
MLQTKCLRCGRKLLIDNIHEGDGYFFGQDTNYYGLGWEDAKDPHEVVGYYCGKCGEKLRTKAETIGYERID